MGWSEADLRAHRKGEPRKVDLAWELRSQTTMPPAWLLQQRGKSRHAAPANPASINRASCKVPLEGEISLWGLRKATTSRRQLHEPRAPFPEIDNQPVVNQHRL